MCQLIYSQLQLATLVPRREEILSFIEVGVKKVREVVYSKFLYSDNKTTPLNALWQKVLPDLGSICCIDRTFRLPQYEIEGKLKTD